MFQPMDINTKNSPIDADTTSARAAYKLDSTGMASGTIVIYRNPSDTVIFVRSGDSSVVATTGDTPILPGAIETFSKNSADTHFAAITASGSGKRIYANVGGGI